jgi:hypothetical protein
VVVLDQDRIVEAEAMIEAAAAAHRVFFERPQPRRGLARAADAGVRAGDAAHEFMRRGRHARKAAEQIERHAFGGEHRAGGPVDGHQRGLGCGAHAVTAIGRDPDPGRELLKRRGDQRQAGDHAGGARDHDRVRRRVLRNGRDRGDVAGTAEILGQCARDHRVDLQRREEGVGAEQGCGHDKTQRY